MIQAADLLKSVRLLVFEDGPEGHPYSIGGTCFCVQYRGKYLAVTAKHCLTARPNEAVRIALIERSNGMDFIPIRAVHELRPDSQEAVELSDLTFLELKHELLTPTQKAAQFFVDCDYLSTRQHDLQAGDLLVTRGCPFSLSEIDYEKFHLLSGYLASTAIYKGRGYASHTHLLKFSDPSVIEHLNGLSGSPVFKLMQPPDGESEHWFAGVIQRANNTGTAQFVDSAVVFHYLEQIAGMPG